MPRSPCSLRLWPSIWATSIRRTLRMTSKTTSGERPPNTRQYALGRKVRTCTHTWHDSGWRPGEHDRSLSHRDDPHIRGSLSAVEIGPNRVLRSTCGGADHHWSSAGTRRAGCAVSELLYVHLHA